MKRRRICKMPAQLLLLTACLITLFPRAALAWNALGHEVIAYIAYSDLTASARSRVDAILADDTDNLTGYDFVSRSIWADRVRFTRPGPDGDGTTEWHFIRLTLNHPDFDSVCAARSQMLLTLNSSLNHQRKQSGECIVDKLYQFLNELSLSSTPQTERVKALKFLISLVGDVHQPTHVADQDDDNGDCVVVRSSYSIPGTKLQGFWDSVTVNELAHRFIETTTPLTQADSVYRARQLGTALRQSITQPEHEAWASDFNSRALKFNSSWAEKWALESLQVAKTRVYQGLPHSSCGDRGFNIVPLSRNYEINAVNTAEIQLKKAGVRLGALLNWALDQNAFAIR